MGVFGRFGEKIKQSFGCGVGGADDGTGWKPTSNARNTQMLKEAKKFAQNLRRFHADILAWGNSHEDGMATVKGLLEAPLPKAYHETVLGVVAVDPTEQLVGVNVRTDVLPQAVETMKTKLQEEVLHPLEQWLTAYKTTKERNKKCQTVRLDLDAQTREAANLTEKFQKLEGSDHREALESTKYKMQTATDKRDRLAARYTDMEKEVYNALLTLIQDTSCVREHVATALLVMQGLFGATYGSFDMITPIRPPMMPPIEANQLATPVLMENSKALRQSMHVGTGMFTGMSGGGASTATSVAGDPNPFSASGGGARPETRVSEAGLTAATTESAANPFGTVKGAKGGSNSGALPPPPAWYTEAKAKAKAPADYDSDDDGGNPFAAPKSKGPSRPGTLNSRPGTVKGQRPKAAF